MTWPVVVALLGALGFVAFVLHLRHRSALHLDAATAAALRAETKRLADSTQSALDAAAKAHQELADRLTNLRLQR